MLVESRRKLRSVITVAACVLVIAPTAARKVDVGDHRLVVRVKGDGTPAIVLDAGLGMTMATWDDVWPLLRKSARVVMYDRAGLGGSDPGPTPRTSEQMVEELRSLLEAIDVAPPYLLVGHSLGGLNVRLFASRYPESVSGLVLIDPTPEDFPALERRRLTDTERRRADTQRALSPETVDQEWTAALQSAEIVRNSPLPEGLPVTVISAGRPDESEDFRRSWLEMQAEMSARIGAKQVVSESAGHFVHYDELEVVVSEILAMLDDLRKAASRPSSADRPPDGSGPGSSPGRP